MKSLCAKLLSRFAKEKHSPLVESCSEEFLPIMAPPSPAVSEPQKHMFIPSQPLQHPQQQQQQPPQQQHQEQQTIYISNQQMNGRQSSRASNKKSSSFEHTYTGNRKQNNKRYLQQRDKLHAQCDDDHDSCQEFDFTLYDLNGYGRVTKEDIAGLVRTIYERIGAKIEIPQCGTRKIRVKLQIDDEFKNDQTRQSPIRVTFNEEQLLYETIKIQRTSQQMADLSQFQKCDHNPRSRNAKRMPTSDALRRQSTQKTMHTPLIKTAKPKPSSPYDENQDDLNEQIRKLHTQEYLHRAQQFQRKNRRYNQNKTAPEQPKGYFAANKAPRIPVYVNAGMFISPEMTMTATAAAAAAPLVPEKNIRQEVNHVVHHHYHYHQFAGSTPNDKYL